MDIVVGAGVTGLSYAMFAKERDILVVEKESTVGGYCRTTVRNNFVWDYSGHFFHFQDPEIKSLVLENMDKNELVDVVKQTKIKYKNLLVDYPFQKNIHQLDKEELLDCLYDLFVSVPNSYSNFLEMLYCKFGKSIAEKFLIPYNEKLYACNLNTLDKDAMGRFFPYADREDIIQNFRKADNTSYNGRFVYSRKGAIAYVHSILSRLNQHKIKLNAEVKHINPVEHKLVLSSGEEFCYDRLISTLPFPVLLEKSGIGYDRTIYSWNQVLVFNLGFDTKGTDQTNHWLYFPEKKYSFYRVGFYDNILGSDQMSLYVELGFNKDTKINPHEWLGKVLKDLKETEIITEDQTLIDYESIIMNPAYVHINSASIQDVLEKKKVLEQHNIYSIGRYGSWTYCSIEDNIKEARELARKNNG